MKHFWVDFNASFFVEAEDEEQAKEKFYNWVPRTLEFVNIDTVERIWEKEEEEE